MPALRGLAGTNALVTGGAEGQGFSHGLALTEAGFDIAVLDDSGARCLPLPCDMRYELRRLR